MNRITTVDIAILLKTACRFFTIPNKIPTIVCIELEKNPEILF